MSSRISGSPTATSTPSGAKRRTTGLAPPRRRGVGGRPQAAAEDHRMPRSSVKHRPHQRRPRRVPGVDERDRVPEDVLAQALDNRFASLDDPRVGRWGQAAHLLQDRVLGEHLPEGLDVAGLQRAANFGQDGRLAGIVSTADRTFHVPLMAHPPTRCRSGRPSYRGSRQSCVRTAVRRSARAPDGQ